MSDGTRWPEEAQRQRHRTMVMARWVAVAFALVQIPAYAQEEYPDGVRTAAFAFVALLAVGNGAIEMARRRVGDASSVRRLALASLVLDAVVASGLTWVYAFDPVSALFVILVLIPIEGAVYFGLPGAMWTWGGVSVLYIGREWFGTRYDNPWEWPSVTFRVGLIGIVSLIVGLLTRDLVRQREATAAALVEAQRADDWRSRLVTMLAHDVRAPLAVIRTAFATIAQAHDRDPEVVRAAVDAGLRQADRALLLARDLLDMARLEGGSLTLAPERVDLAQLLDEVCSLLPSDAGVTVTVPTGVVVQADPARLEQILFNLLENATHHGAPPVEVVVASTPGAVTIRVRDHGPGVTDPVRLFEAFAGSVGDSVGLGVWTTRQLARAHGGDVTYAPADPGAAFTVTLPAS